MITTEQIKELREKTGVSVMQCKKALEEAGGDIEKALILLRKISGNIAAKKSDRDLGAGNVAAYIHGGGSVGAMIILATETDFVAKNEEFKKLAYDIAMHITAANPTYLKREDIPEEEMTKIKTALESEIPAGKPADMMEKILTGKLEDYYKLKVLLDQPYIKDDSVSINGLIQTATQKFGERIEVSRFVRFAA